MFYSSVYSHYTYNIYVSAWSGLKIRVEQTLCGSCLFLSAVILEACTINKIEDHWANTQFARKKTRTKCSVSEDAFCRWCGDTRSRVRVRESERQRHRARAAHTPEQMCSHYFSLTSERLRVSVSVDVLFATQRNRSGCSHRQCAKQYAFNAIHLFNSQRCGFTLTARLIISSICCECATDQSVGSRAERSSQKQQQQRNGYCLDLCNCFMYDSTIRWYICLIKSDSRERSINAAYTYFCIRFPHARAPLDDEVELSRNATRRLIDWPLRARHHRRHCVASTYRPIDRAAVLPPNFNNNAPTPHSLRNHGVQRQCGQL